MKDKIKEIRYQQQINRLQIENQTLKDIIKQELYNEFMDWVETKAANEHLKETNKRLRDKIKSYQAKEYKGAKKNEK